MTKEEFLLDTIKYYSEDTSRRNVSEKYCKYYPTHPGTKGCAIGRFLDEETAKLFDTYANPGIDNFYRFPQHKSRLPEWMQAMPMTFVSDVQSLHDDSYNWGGTIAYPLRESIELDTLSKHMD